MLSVAATCENARKIIRLATKYALNIDPKIYDITVRSVPNKIDGFNFTLKNYQAEGVAWLESQLGTGLLADEQGTGKTVQVMAYAHKNQKFPMLIVCPNTLKFNWRNEIIAMTSGTYKINVVGKKYSAKQLKVKKSKHPNVTYTKHPEPGHDIYIVNYDILSDNIENLLVLDIQFMAVDESHKIKNYAAKRTKAFVQLAKGVVEIQTSGKKTIQAISKPIPSVVLMSGTPMVNRPSELFTSINTIADYVPEFSAWTRFAFRYCGARINGYGWDFTGASNTNELHTLLEKHVMLRRLKQNVLKELPAKIYTTVPLEFDRAEYDKVASAFDGVDWKTGMDTIISMGGNVPKSDNAIVAIQKLREIAAYAKLDSAVEWIKDFVEENRKLVVFAHNRMAIDKIRDSLEQNNITTRVIYGGISDEDRATAVSDFQTDQNVTVIIVGITAGGFGLTLTAASAVAFIQLPWTPGEINQCADRVHRIGQTADSVNVYNLIAEGTIEEDISQMILSKGLVLDSVLDAGQTVNAVDLTV
jgi:SWI/SNF-related matrix-associated actin-dependent regulator 1 of chromatin subfamily A